MKLLSIHVGLIREVEYHGKITTTGIFKQEVNGPRQVNFLGLKGDKQADLTVHGGENKAVYAYPAHHYDYWEERRPDLEFYPGVFGENLSITGLDEQNVCVGDIYKIGSAVLSVTTPRLPCFKLGIKMGDPTIIKEFLQANKSGFYFKVLEEGIVEAEDVIEKLSDDGYNLSISELVNLYSTEKQNKELLQKAINSPSLQADWRDDFEVKLHRIKNI